MANAPYSAYTNFSWTDSIFSNERMAVILTNDFNEVTGGNGTLDGEWPECLGYEMNAASTLRIITDFFVF
jgi:lysophospholipase